MELIQKELHAGFEERATREWSQYAGESVRCELIGGVLYAFGSELACLRLEHRMQVGRAGYSENLSSWYYSTGKHMPEPIQATLLKEVATYE